MNYTEAVRYLHDAGARIGVAIAGARGEIRIEQHSHAGRRNGRSAECDFARVHIAGTNGKGSTAAMMESILRSAGYRTGLYTSPHLERINERIRVNGAEISDTEFAEAFSATACADREDAFHGGIGGASDIFRMRDGDGVRCICARSGGVRGA